MPQFDIDHFKHARQIAINLAVPETQRPKSRSRYFCISSHIALVVRRLVMLTAIDLDHQFLAHTNEVYNESFTRRLATEVITARSP